MKKIALLAAAAALVAPVGIPITFNGNSDRFLVQMPPSDRPKNRPRAHTVRTGASCAKRAARKRRNIRARSNMASK